ncbi:conserved hypothetical protein [Syntrophobacter sp. SbD1]|nr:conserved hypothetical protein [Syntrophobacter sp. SbD1]
MAEILQFAKKAESFKSERDNVVRQLKIESLRKIFHCTRCSVKCSKCGGPMDAQEQSRFASPYSFCKSCNEEYEEYRSRADGTRPDSDCYWRNSDWLRVWETWLEHQKALDQYRLSKEFLQLIDEVEHLLKK